MSARVQVDRSVCELHAQCVGVAPDIFFIQEDGSLGFEESVDDDEVEAVSDAMFLCPVQAIGLSPGA